MRISYLFTICTGIGLLVAACGQNSEPVPQSSQPGAMARSMPDQPQASSAPSQVASDPSETGTTGIAAGVSWDIPSRWQVQGPRTMRIATYAIPQADGDPEPGECAVFFFGTGQGGSIELNITRWRDQFETADGKSAALNQQKSIINSLAVTTVTVEGSYMASMGPMFQSGAVKKTNYKMLGAIIEAPEGNVFIKMTGPAKTIAGADAEFKSLLNSMKK